MPCGLREGLPWLRAQSCCWLTFLSSASIWPSFCCRSASSPRPVKSVLQPHHTHAWSGQARHARATTDLQLPHWPATPHRRCPQ